MIDNLAVGVQATGSRARILAFVAYASEIGGTVRVQHTLGPAAFVGVSKVIIDASACTGSVLFFADSVGSARTG
jgi:hypothetical protein